MRGVLALLAFWCYVLSVTVLCYFYGSAVFFGSIVVTILVLLSFLIYNIAEGLV